MRRSALPITLAVILALSACSPDTGQAPEPSAEAPKCSEAFTGALEKNGHGTDGCWTVDGASKIAAVAGDTILALKEPASASENRVKAISASDGSDLWESDYIGAAAEFPAPPSLHVFRSGEKELAVLGYYSGGAYEVRAYDMQTGETAFEASHPVTGTGRATWGDNALAVTTGAGEAAVLTGTTKRFNPVPSLPWATKTGIEGVTEGYGKLADRALYVTEDVLVLDHGRTSSGIEGVQVISHSGVPVTTLAAEDPGASISFAGDYALLAPTPTGAVSWINLQDGSVDDAPKLTPGQQFAATPEDGDNIQRFTTGVVSPDGATLLANMRFGFKTDGSGVSSKVAGDVLATAASNEYGYAENGPTIDLTTWLPVENRQVPLGYSLIGVAELEDGVGLVLGGKFGIGLVREP